MTVIDLGSAPPANAYLAPLSLHAPEIWFPLRVLVCTECWLVQTEDYACAEELFSPDYAYFSSVSTTWLRHAEDYVTSIIHRLGLGNDSRVVEVGANDGYLLQYFKARGIPCLGVEPTAGTAAAAREKGIEIIENFFSEQLAEELSADGWPADLMVANNVLAHVPDINDFVSGFNILLKSGGVATFEFPHLMNIVSGIQFDTVYHEHYSYLSLTAVMRILEHHGLDVFDVEELETHGGSLRVFAQKKKESHHERTVNVEEILARESMSGVKTLTYYSDFQSRAEEVKDNFLSFLLDAKRQGKQVVAYGAAAKGNTLLNYAGVRTDLIDYVADRNPAKQGHYLPGSRIPIVDERRISETRPDYVVILPWNLYRELTAQLAYIREWGAQLVTAVPAIAIS
jgi:SAM-dependent methyltransferase